MSSPRWRWSLLAILICLCLRASADRAGVGRKFGKESTLVDFGEGGRESRRFSLNMSDETPGNWTNRLEELNVDMEAIDDGRRVWL